MPLDKETLLRDCADPSSDDEESDLADEITELCEIVARISQLRLDHTEYTCLKALVLFKPEVLSLKQPLQVEVLQDQTHLMLQEYCMAKAVSSNKVRFGRLLLLLPSVNKFNKKTIETQFFRRTLGNIRVDRLVVDLAQVGWWYFNVLRHSLLSLLFTDGHLNWPVTLFMSLLVNDLCTHNESYSVKNVN